MQEYLVDVMALRYLTADVVELEVRLVAPDMIDFKAGQYMFFKVGTEASGKELLRCYSMASPPIAHDPILKFVIRLVPKGVGSEYIKALIVGQSITMQGPTGGFAVPDMSRDLFFVAGGIGVAPFCAMVPDLLSKGFTGNLRLLFGLHNEETVFYYHKFKELLPLHPNFSFIPILSHPESHWPGETGRVTTYLSVSYPHYRNSVFYICGSPEMVKDSRQVLLQAGHPARDIKVEIFT
jgi:ferredoxin-NADP reductase